MLFKGSAVALVTPFTRENTVNYNKLEELVEFHIKNIHSCKLNLLFVYLLNSPVMRING